MSPVQEPTALSAHDAADLKRRAGVIFHDAEENILDFSHRIHAHPELGMQEELASTWLAEELESIPGARVVRGLGALPTALRAEVGSGSLVLTLCAEYDALPDVGHACGHNIIAAAALGAFTALAPLTDELGATIRLLGTPAEETLGGKITMLEQGDFDGTHAALMIHPGDRDTALMRPYACSGFRVIFRGKSSHASADPSSGVNALDALTVALTAIGLARQQLPRDQQIHGYVVRAGSAPNVIPDTAEAEYMVRASTVESLLEVTQTLRRCLQAGAMATGATLEFEEVGHSYLSMDDDEVLRNAFSANSSALGRDLAPTTELAGSTDMGNISQVFPSIHPMIGLGPGCPPIHTPEFAAFSASPAGDLAVRDGALALAWTCIDMATSPEQRGRLSNPG